MNEQLCLKKSLGQNFLKDNNIINKIVESCPDLLTSNVLEVGPGNGSLTKALLPKCIKLFAIEKDKDLTKYLQEIKENYCNFSFQITDALSFNLNNLESTNKWVFIANLPYNVGTVIYTNWLPYSNRFKYFVLMFQKEVALRITANANNKHYGRLALITQLYGSAELLFIVKNTCFYPKPAVDSAVIRFIPHKVPIAVNHKLFLLLVKTAFNTRRKTIKVSLKKYNLPFEHLGLNPMLRPENLSFKDFVTLTNYLEQNNYVE